MPIVKIKGKVKKFPYTKKGKKEANKLAKRNGISVMHKEY